MKRIFIIVLTTASFWVLNACSNNTESQATGEGEQTKNAKEHAVENIASLTVAQMKAIGLELGLIEQKELTNSIKANGVLSVPNQNKAFVTPLFSGVIKSLNVRPGAFVKQGQTIATIVNPDLIQLQQQLQQVNTQITMSEIEVKRQKELVEGNAAPLKRLQQVQTELSVLKSQRSGLQKQLAALGASQNYSSTIAVKAPISGAVSRVMVQLGSNVDVSTPIAEIVNNSQLHLDLYVFEKDLSKLRPNQTIHFTITNNAGKEYDADIFSIGTAFEPGSKTIQVHSKVIGDKTGLIDGMNVTALVSLDKSTVPAVPTDAIVSYQGNDYIFVVTDTHDHAANSTEEAVANHQGEEGVSEVVFEKFQVAKGTTDIGYSEITLLKEIPAGAKIVIKGAFFILAKMTNSGEHEH